VIEHEDDPLDRSRTRPARFGEQPGQDEDPEQLQPERDRLPQPVELASFHTLTIDSFEEKEGAHGESPRLALEEVNQQYRGDPEQSPETEGIGENERHDGEGSKGYPICSAPPGMASSLSEASKVGAEAMRARGACARSEAAFHRPKWSR